MTNYFALIDGVGVKALGACEDFGDADDKAPPNTNWIYDEDGAQALMKNLVEVLA